MPTTRRGFLGLLGALVASCGVRPAFAAPAPPTSPLILARDVPARLCEDDIDRFPHRHLEILLNGEPCTACMAYDLDAQSVDILHDVVNRQVLKRREQGRVEVRWRDDAESQEVRAEYLAGCWPTAEQRRARA